MIDYLSLTFKCGWDNKDEKAMKGYRSDGLVETSEGAYAVYFIEPIRLQQDLEAETELGTPFLAEPGLIILPEVTLKAMENAVHSGSKVILFSAFKTRNSKRNHRNNKGDLEEISPKARLPDRVVRSPFL